MSTFVNRRSSREVIATLSDIGPSESGLPALRAFRSDLKIKLQWDAFMACLGR